MSKSLSEVIDNKVKLSKRDILEDNTDKGYTDKIESAYIRQDKLLSKKLKKAHDSMLSEVEEAHDSGDKDAFDTAFGKLRKLSRLLAKGDDEDSDKYLSKLAQDEKDREDESEGEDDRKLSDSCAYTNESAKSRRDDGKGFRDADKKLAESEEKHERDEDDKDAEIDDKKEAKKKLSSFSRQIRDIEKSVASFLGGNEVIKLSEDKSSNDSMEKVEKGLFDDMQTILDKLKRTH